ncbi:MAG: hypothetical protein IJ684_04955 [Bacteroidales bacterium]|nr:hypothetical protein [Bacteroidales bacterium]
MTTMFVITMALVIVLTVAVCGWIFYLVTRRYFDNEQKRQLLQVRYNERAEAAKRVTPLRLQAYERMALFLERISPNSLVLRCYRPGMDVKSLQSAMTKSIRDEWEHNLAQQVYVSSELWNRIREAKEEMVNLVNASAVNIAADADPSSLAGSIFASVAQHRTPTDSALEYLKKEIGEYFG